MAGLTLFAGLYEYWQRGPDDSLRSLTIVTTNGNATVEPIHDRMR